MQKFVALFLMMALALGVQAGTNTVALQSWTQTQIATATNGLLRSESDPVALLALATNRVIRTWDTNGHWYVESGGTRTEFSRVAQMAWRGWFNVNPTVLFNVTGLPDRPLIADGENPDLFDWSCESVDEGNLIASFGTYLWASDTRGSVSGSSTGVTYDDFSIGYIQIWVTNSITRYLSDAPPLTNETWGATNLVAHGTAATYNADTRTLDASNLLAGGSGTNSIVQTIAVSTNVIHVVPTSSLYYVAVTSPCVVLQDVSALNLSGSQAANWTLYLDMTDWSATNGITFATNIEASVGEFTCTGRYEFACSALGGNMIRAKQTYPTVQEWEPVIGSSHLYGAYITSSGTEYPSPFVSSATNGVLMFLTSTKMPVFFQTRFRQVDTNGDINATMICGNATMIYGMDGNAKIESYNFPICYYLTESLRFVCPPISISGDRVGEPYERQFLLYINTTTLSSYNVCTQLSSWRILNELELKAYNAGKRDW